MIRIHHAGKMGDLIYSLPVMRALHRTRGERIHLTTSGLGLPLAPLLEEQPYIGEVVIDATRPYKIADGVTTGWEFYAPDEGLNFSLQPRMYGPSAPVRWSECYAQIAGVEIQVADHLALPTLVNHRRWLLAHQVAFDGVPALRRPTAVVAPDGETLDEILPETWGHVIDALRTRFTVLVVGKRREASWVYAVDLRGLTSVPAMARLIAEAAVFIGAHSAPWQIARHTEVPAVCLQRWRPGLVRCLPVDTPCTWIEPEDWKRAVEVLTEQYEAEGATA